MSRYVLAHIELPLELFPDGTHKIHNDRSNIYFETLGRLPPYQENTQFDLSKLLTLSSQSPQTSITKVSLEENTNSDETLVFRSVIPVSDDTASEETASETSDEGSPTEEDLGKVLEKQYVVHKHEILPRRPKSARYTFRIRPKHKSSLYSRRAPV